MAKKVSPTINFKLSKIETLQFAIIDENYIDSKEVAFSIQLSLLSKKEKKLFAVAAKISFEQKNKAFLILEIACHFAIKPDAWKTLTKDDGKVVLPKGLVAHLAALTVSAARGVIHAKTENTKYNRHFLATVNVAEMIKDDVII